MLFVLCATSILRQFLHVQCLFNTSTALTALSWPRKVQLAAHEKDKLYQQKMTNGIIVFARRRRCDMRIHLLPVLPFMRHFIAAVARVVVTIDDIRCLRVNDGLASRLPGFGRTVRERPGGFRDRWTGRIAPSIFSNYLRR